MSTSATAVIGPCEPGELRYPRPRLRSVQSPAGAGDAAPTVMPKGVSVLVVDDDPKLANLMGLALERSGHEVEIVYSGDEALWATDWFQPRVVVLDVMIPGPDGYEVCALLSEHHPEIGTVIVTARHGQRDRECAFEVGAARYLTKPFAMSELTKSVDDLALGRNHPVSHPALIAPPAR